MQEPSSPPEPSGHSAKTLRLFVAVDLSYALRAQLMELKKDFPEIGWVVPQNLHLTVRFLGDQEHTQAKKARDALRQVRVAPFSLCVRGLGLFEGRQQAVLWAGLEHAASLRELRRQVDGVLGEAIGLDRDQGDFSPHITLSRVRTGVSAVLREKVARHRFASEGFVVESFVLFRSVLSPAGASHAPLERYPLLARNR